MATWLVVVLFSVGAVLLFVVGMSLTLIFKGHDIDSEIATNRHMRARGITCAAADARADHVSGRSTQSAECDDSSCANCTDRCMSSMN